MTDEDEKKVGLMPMLGVFLATAITGNGGIRGQVRSRVGQVIVIALAIIFVVVGTLVAAEMSGPFFDAVAALAENFSDPQTGIALIDALGPILALVIAVALIFGLVMAIIRLARFD